MNGRLLSALSWRHTSSPSSLGIMMSSRIRSGSLARAQRQRLLAVGGHHELVAVRLQPPRKDVAVGLVVVDDEDQGRLAH